MTSMTSSGSTLLTSGLAMLVVGITLTSIGGTMHGFARGLLQGGGIALILLSVVLMAAQLRKGRGDTWLPSRDEEGHDR